MKPTHDMVAEYKSEETLFTISWKKFLAETNYPTGAFYFFPDVSSFYGKSDGTKTIKNGDDLCFMAVGKRSRFFVPGGAFGDEACVRLSTQHQRKICASLCRDWRLRLRSWNKIH